jgi:hypothetical protein
MSDDKIKKLIDTQLGEGYYDFILKAGIVAGVPKEKLAKELETSVANIDEMKRAYRAELGDLMVHRAIAEQVFMPLATVKMTKLLMEILTQVEDDLTMGAIPPNVKADLLKFFTKQIAATKLADDSELPELESEEVKERALRLLKETG